MQGEATGHEHSTKTGRRLAAVVVRGVANASHVPARTGVALIVAGLGLSWLLGWAVGGAEVSPHWFYVPIFFAALRFRARGALLTGLAATVLAGPLLPEVVASGTGQPASTWVVRGVFFVLFGMLSACTFLGGIEAHRQQSADLRRARDLRTAITRDELTLQYQPIFALGGGGLVGAEALVRWERPGHGLVPPNDFLPHAERTGDIVDVDRWVLDRAAAQAAAWNRRRDRAPVVVSVNVSGVSLAEPDLASRVRTVLDRHGLDPALLRLEITETALLVPRQRLAEELGAVRDLGVTVAIDDFGAGWSSYGQVAELPFDVIKLDRSLVCTVGDDDKHRQVLQGLVELARALDASTVAEGVETEAQAAAVRELGCDAAQGWLYARPSPPDVVAERTPWIVPGDTRVEQRPARR